MKLAKLTRTVSDMDISKKTKLVLGSASSAPMVTHRGSNSHLRCYRQAAAQGQGDMRAGSAGCRLGEERHSRPARSTTASLVSELEAKEH